MDSSQDPVSHSGPQLSDSLRLFLQEMSAFKQQNPGKVRVMEELEAPSRFFLPKFQSTDVKSKPAADRC